MNYSALSVKGCVVSDVFGFLLRGISRDYLIPVDELAYNSSKLYGEDRSTV